jgi:chlorophyllide a oxygenase
MSEHAFDGHWYPIALSRMLKRKAVQAWSFRGEPLVLFRDEAGKVGILQDRCPHRATPLSLGRVVGNTLECRYHGWRFSPKGACAGIPSCEDNVAQRLACAAFAKPCYEADGIIWLYSDRREHHVPSAQPDDRLLSRQPGTYRFCVAFDLPVPHALMVENLLDPAHLPFAHHGTLSRRSKACPIHFETEATEWGFSGVAYHDDGKGMATQHFHFEAPCTVVLSVDLGKGRCMRQRHACLPVTPTSMRLISILEYEGMPYLRWIPGMRRLNRYVSSRIVRQDLAMLKGQAERLQQGAPAWHRAVPADRLAMLYRHWLSQQEEACDFKAFPASECAE